MPSRLQEAQHGLQLHVYPQHNTTPPLIPSLAVCQAATVPFAGCSSSLGCLLERSELLHHTVPWVPSPGSCHVSASSCFSTYTTFHSQTPTANVTATVCCAGLGDLPQGSALFHPEDEEHLYIQRRIRDNPMWTLDRGTGFYVQERLSKKKASLLGSGK